MLADYIRDSLAVYMTDPNVTTLGPGTRYTIWVQGCPLGCPGCLVPDSHEDLSSTRHPLSVISQDIITTHGIEGVTLSGGEPFAQASQLAKLIEEVREVRDIGVIVYTGYTQRELLKGIITSPRGDWAQLYSLVDLLIDGRYVKKLNDNRPLRGSSNQNIIPLTSRYLDYTASYGAEDTWRSVKLTYDSDSLRILGIPSSELLKSLYDRGYLSHIEIDEVYDD
jgi:anaerobic ribonucleoside-triphosphate reductase activating protein